MAGKFFFARITFFILPQNVLPTHSKIEKYLRVYPCTHSLGKSKL